MKALVKKGRKNARVEDIKRPDEKTVVKTLRVGIDGTDREVLEEDNSVIPSGDEKMILGHEAVGRVESSDELEEGKLVVPTVRRASDTCPSRFSDRADFCAPGSYVERGIYRAHGFCSTYFAEDSRYLVRIPEELEDIGVLVEPTSIVVKALDQALKAQQRLDFEPNKALVLGAGSIGLLGTMMLERKGFEVETVDVVDQDHRKVKILEDIGAGYVDNREKSIEDLDSPDLILESSGVSEQIFKGLKNLSPNGALVSLGLPRDLDSSRKIDIGEIHQEMVMKNKMLIGSVNSSATHFEEAVEHLKYFNQNFPIKKIIDQHVEPQNWEKAFKPEIKGEIVFRGK